MNFDTVIRILKNFAFLNEYPDFETTIEILNKIELFDGKSSISSCFQDKYENSIYDCVLNYEQKKHFIDTLKDVENNLIRFIDTDDTLDDDGCYSYVIEHLPSGRYMMHKMGYDSYNDYDLIARWREVYKKERVEITYTYE